MSRIVTHVNAAGQWKDPFLVEKGNLHADTESGRRKKGADENEIVVFSRMYSHARWASAVNRLLPHTIQNVLAFFGLKSSKKHWTGKKLSQQQLLHPLPAPEWPKFLPRKTHTCGLPHPPQLPNPLYFTGEEKLRLFFRLRSVCWEYWIS